MISAIAAMSENRVIGKDNKLPWHLPEDLKFFRDTTKGHAIIMGRKTFESMPKALPHRLNVVITRQENYQAPGAHVFRDISSAVEFCQSQRDEWGDEIFIIGGAEIYRQTLEITDRIYLTLIHETFEGDAFFPEFDLNAFKEVERVDKKGPPPFSFLVYERQN